MDPRKNSSSSTIAINGALDNQALRHPRETTFIPALQTMSRQADSNGARRKPPRQARSR